MRQHVAAAVVMCFLFSGLVFSQGNAALGGVVTDQSGALIPGVTITVTNTETGVSTMGVTNESGAYQFASVQPGRAYRVSATLPGFQTATVTNLELSGGIRTAQNFRLQVAGTTQSVEVTVDRQGALTASSSSIGDVLPQDRIQALPLVGNNVLDLLQILPGLRLSPLGDQANTIGGLGINTINVTRDGMPIRDERFSAEGNVTLEGNPTFFGAYQGGNQLLATTVLNPDLVGEIRLILSPVDAELGRGNSQIQITTRSGTNRYTGSAVWNIQNSAFNANSWGNNNDVVNGVWTPTTPNWRNTHQYTLSYGGPIIRNKTFFYVLWDQQISNTREIQTNTVLTDSARNGIFRFWEGWVPDDFDGNTPTFPTFGANPSLPSIDSSGNPLRPQFWPEHSSANPQPYTGRLICFSIFGTVKADGSPFGGNDCPSGEPMLPPSGSVWDTKRPGAFNSAGYFAKILEKMPRANDFTGGDGLNYANFRWLLGRGGNNANESIVGSEAYSNRKQINVKVDQNFAAHRFSVGWTYQLDDNADNVGDWPNSYSGVTYRRPQTVTVNATSTFSSTLLNEARFGLNYNKTQSLPAWLSPDTARRDEARSFLVNGGTRPGSTNVYPVVIGPSTGSLDFDSGVMETQTAMDAVTQVGYTNPLYNFADTLSWTRGKHSLKFGGDFRFPRSNGFTLMPYPIANYGNIGGNRTLSPLASDDTAGFATPTLGGTATPNATNCTATVTTSCPRVVNQFPQTARNVARDLAFMLTDSVGSVTMPYWAENYSDTTNTTPPFYGWQDTSTQDNRFRKMVYSDFAIFAKDDYKVTNNLTLNLGVRYEYYSPPYIESGLTSTAFDQGNGLFGASRGAGYDLFNSWLRPGNLYLSGYGNNAATLPAGTNFLDCVKGVRQNTDLPLSTCDPSLLTQIEFIGPNSPNAGKTIIPRDRNNIGPAIGFAWQVPFFGEGKTTVRGGYQVTFSRVNVPEGTLASALGGSLTQNYGQDDATIVNFTGSGAGQLNRAITINDLPSLVPVLPSRGPGQTVPVYARSSSITAYDPNYATPYTQNLTLSVTRSLARNMTLDVRWVGTLARKQSGSLSLNTNTVMYNPELFDELVKVRHGDESPFFDQMLAGLRLTGVPAGYGTVGAGSTGAQQLRRANADTDFFTPGNQSFTTYLAEGNFSGLTNLLVTQTAAAGAVGATQGAQGVTLAPSQTILRNGCNRIANNLTNIPTRCFSENYLIANPQLSGGTYNANLGRSNYHALQVQFTLRPTQGISLQSTYSWAKSMQLGGGGYTDPLMRDADRARGREGPHSLRMNGTVELPFGPNKVLFGNASGWVARLIERWQTSFILNMASGSPADILGAGTTRYGNARYVVASPYWRIPDGKVEWGYGANGGEGRFYGDSVFLNAPDPQCADSTLVMQGAQVVGTDTFNFASNCGLDALAMAVPDGTADSYLLGGVPVVNLLVNPKPGEVGTLGMRTLSYWGQFSLDANAQKTFRLTESKALSLRIDSTNILNHPQPAIPNYSVGTGTFGAITSGFAPAKSGSRTFQAQIRLTF